MARATGLEPAASGVTGRRSNQLSYARSSVCDGANLPSESDPNTWSPGPSQAMFSAVSQEPQTCDSALASGRRFDGGAVNGIGQITDLVHRTGFNVFAKPGPSNAGPSEAMVGGERVELPTSSV